MNEFVIRIEGLKELTEAVKALTGVQAKPELVAAAAATTAPAALGTYQAPVQQTPVPTVPPQNYGQAPVQPAVPVTMGVQQPQDAAVPAVPTTAMPQGYTIEQLQVAAAGLSSMGKMPQVIGILQQFGIQAMTELPKERYGEFATALREAGAQI